MQTGGSSQEASRPSCRKNVPVCRGDPGPLLVPRVEETNQAFRGGNPPDHHTWYSQNPTLVSSKAEPRVRDTNEKEEGGAGSGVLCAAQGSVRRRLCVEHLLPVCPEFLEQEPSGAF